MGIKQANKYFNIHMDKNGGYCVQGPNGRTYHFASPHEAREMMERNMEMSYGKYSDAYDANETEDYPLQEPVEVDISNKNYEQSDKKVTKEYIGWDTPKQSSYLEEEARSQPLNQAIAKIQAEIDRVEAQIAKSRDEDNKAKMTVYVAGMVKSLKLLKGE